MDEQALALDSATRQLNTIRFLAEAEMQKYADIITDFEKRIEELEQAQVSRQEFEALKLEVDALRARIEKLEQTQRSITEVVIRI